MTSLYMYRMQRSLLTDVNDFADAYVVFFNSLFKRYRSNLVQTFVNVLRINIFFFGQTIDVALIKLYDYLRWCMEINMATWKRYEHSGNRAVVVKKNCRVFLRSISDIAYTCIFYFRFLYLYYNCISSLFHQEHCKDEKELVEYITPVASR